jgi:hypothetical protein
MKMLTARVAISTDTDPRPGNLRPLAMLREEGRKKIPLNQLLKELGNPPNRRER